MVNTVVIEETGITIVAESSTTSVAITQEPQNAVTISSIGAQGTQGPQGQAGEDYEQDFETVSKNLKSWDATFAYTEGVLQTITYTDGVDTIVKTFNYTDSVLTTIVLSGDTPAGIDLTKTFNYTSSVLTSITYS